MDSGDNEVVVDFPQLIRVYKSGRVERLFSSPIVPPSPEDPTTGVASKDIDISPEIQARIYLPKLTNLHQTLPILVYYHGGGFCLESAFSFLDHRYMNRLVSESNAIVISVEYRLAPEYPLPVGYEDSWTALQWVGSHVADQPGFKKEPWLVNHGDFEKVFIGGDSAGGNIVYNISLRAGTETINGGIKILGSLLCFPYFITSKDFKEDSLPSRMWVFVNPAAENGVDDPRINPFVEKDRLSLLGCSKTLVCVAEKDELRDIGIQYVEAVKKSEWNGEIELIDAEGEDHCFQIFDTETEKAKNLIKRMANFIKQSCV
ncbi:2-hydroxyisoflavanone dehydratase [Capsicum annuum]|jgi:acetyl esterase/lipase|uniref:2-hydroxyisoflavanone dehydratase n=1 Tax=Capsicum annuum TaxID=4072 RepID=A0A1U8G399_CAPAN|nr:2-hydroxyisoflavanone dehydratase [Capsicum annuum]KAF3613143.1 2-hydroxyisoflavanone dehydratase [Capsicum annuum]KAF3614224.1 2-hydroxyisoflavanone dehydratase [Capsicum annuum]PHT86022.1 2-hydroxyisoflavanone dehydratase [Capsicum annuum]